jgi:hypothetical protein
MLIARNKNPSINAINAVRLATNTSKIQVISISG